MVNDLTRGDLRARFSWRNTDLSAEDIIICEVIPGEIYLCNTLIKNRKRGSSLIILHSYDQLPEDEFMINCLKGVIFVSLKTASIPQLLTIIKNELQHCMTPRLPTPQAGNSAAPAVRIACYHDRRPP
ncbi:positive transcription regulator [Klebsiella pneumoniae]|uniref:Positive transcription regulator n=1 Tax=Klebsiella pneumoniae TaxID=573 RepID=A0A378FWH1_KLEPN|nr:positive transcription regulator [Klebsiella pneumoniae]